MIGICGKGFVGNALYELLKPLDPIVYDKFKKIGNEEDLKKCKVIFLCLPTPYDWDKEQYDLSAIEETLPKYDPDVYVIKSTTAIGDCDLLSKKYGKKIIHNPEFLREQTAIEDIKNANRTVLGGDQYLCTEVQRIYQRVYDSDMIYVFTDSRTSELIKLATNAYLSSKVIFCNTLKNICCMSNINYDVFKEAWLLEPRVGRSHTQVTEEGGFGGHCFPKDLNALISRSRDFGYDPKILVSVWNENCKIRKEFNGKER